MRGKEQLLCLCGNDSERRGGRGAFFRGVAGQAGTRRSLFGTRGKIDWVCTLCTQPAAERRTTPLGWEPWILEVLSNMMNHMHGFTPTRSKLMGPIVFVEPNIAKL